MLTISKALNSSQAQSYHKLEFTSDSQNYYKQGDTVKGEWQGKLAASLGLKGEVAPLEFYRLSEGIHPQTEEQMVKHRLAHEYTNADGSTTKAGEHRAGWDATFSAPKSVSLTALVGGDERVREAHRSAVSTALDEPGALHPRADRRQQPRREYRTVHRCEVRARHRSPGGRLRRTAAPHTRGHIQCD